MAAALLLLPLCFTGRAMLTGRVYAPLDLAYTKEPLAAVARQVGVTHTVNASLSDVYAQFIPWNVALRAAVHRGEWPLWNPYELAGDPLAGAAQSAPYHPVTLLGLLLPLADGLTFTAAMTYLLAALSMFLFLRALEVDELPSLFGAAAWALSTHIVSFILTAHGLSIAIAPLVFLGGHLIARAPSIRSAAVLTLAALLRVRRREVWFFAVVVIFACLAGAEAPGVNDLLKHLPLFSIAVNARLIAFAAMGLCVLAAIGIERVDVWLFLGTAVVLA